MHRSDVIGNSTSANADLLDGESIDPMPSDGYLRVYVVSTVNTCTVAIDPAKHISPTGAGVQAAPIRANGEIRAYDPHWELAVSAGEKVVIQIAGTTGTYYYWVSFVGKHA